MATQGRLNVLVYTGPGTTVASVRHCIYSLRRSLSPNYAVAPLTESALLKEPWPQTTALLVIPGGADLSYCRVLDGLGTRIITDFVRRLGGAYLGFCAGAYYASARCEFEVGHPDRSMEVIGSRELAFFPGTCRGGAFKGFRYASESGARAVTIAVHRDALPGAHKPPDTFRVYCNGGGVFVDAASAGLKDQGVDVLASYQDPTDVDGGDGSAAVLYRKIGSGAAIMAGPHPEFAAVNLEPQADVPGYDGLIKALAEDDAHRCAFLKSCLTKLGLRVSHQDWPVLSLSQLHLSALDPQQVGRLVASFDDIITRDADGREHIEGENDTFYLETQGSRWLSPDLSRPLRSTDDDFQDGMTANYEPGRGAAIDGVIDYNKIPKAIVPHKSSWTEPRETPCFNHNDFYSSLQELRQCEGEAYAWGDVLMYGEVVTSTNTLLEKNPTLLSKLPTGFTMAATTQVAGRGRGTNVWIAPAGCLLASIVINHPAQISTTRPVVFIQYLAAMAIVEAIRSYDGKPRGAYSGLPVRLKWPNDIYAQDPAAPYGDDQKQRPNYVKVGGILTNCAYSSGTYQLVVGMGINTTNSKPTTSLAQVLSAFSTRHKVETFRIERLLARITTTFETVYRQFVRDGFTGEMEHRFYASWLHSGQEVSLEAEGGGVRARVVGITTDWGLLKVHEIDQHGTATGRVWALQSDENSFDFWKGLVKRKA